jgi:hypothetical protein
MNNNLEELVRDGIDRLTAESHIPDNLVGRARRQVAQQRRSMRAMAVGGAAVTAAAAAIVVTSVASSGRQATAQLAAWTVTKLADGDVSVTIRELTDPAGLQSRLRTDGVPASVTLAGEQNPACRPYPGGTPAPARFAPARRLGGTALLGRVFPKPYQGLGFRRGHPGRARMIRAAHGRPTWRSPSPGTVLIVIDPSALPINAGVQITTVYGGQRGAGMPTVVYASPQCTGS